MIWSSSNTSVGQSMQMGVREGEAWWNTTGSFRDWVQEPGGESILNMVKMFC